MKTRCLTSPHAEASQELLKAQFNHNIMDISLARLSQQGRVKEGLKI